VTLDEPGEVANEAAYWKSHISTMSRDIAFRCIRKCITKVRAISCNIALKWDRKYYTSARYRAILGSRFKKTSST
jgi:hypothetical protein